MLNINESMWRDSATTASMAKPNAWGNPDMAITRRAQFNSSENLENPTATTPSASASASEASARLKFMFPTPEDMAETVLFSGGAPKMGHGLEDAMERLSMVSLDHIKFHDA